MKTQSTHTMSDDSTSTPDKRSETSATKPCKNCGVEKTLDQFSPQKRGKLGRCAWCKPCRSTRSNASQDKDQRAAYMKEWHATPAGKHAIYKGGAAKRGYSFDLTPDDTQAMFECDCHYC